MYMDVSHINGAPETIKTQFTEMLPYMWKKIDNRLLESMVDPMMAQV